MICFKNNNSAASLECLGNLLKLLKPYNVGLLHMLCISCIKDFFFKSVMGILQRRASYAAGVLGIQTSSCCTCVSLLDMQLRLIDSMIAEVR